MPIVVSEAPRGGAAPPGGRPRERGQATVEFVALLPLLAFLALAAGQAAVAGWTAWSAAGAARVAARAEALGDDPAVAARRVLPAMLWHRARVSVGRPGGAAEHRTSVRLRIPSLLPGLAVGHVSVGAELPSQEPGP